MVYTDIEKAIEKENLMIPALDGFRLAATLFRWRSTDGPLVIIAAATAVKRSYYRKFAQFLAQNGFQALTFDYRGIGRSRPESLKGFHAEMHEWGTLDLAGVINWITAVVAPSQILLVGHSVAGQIFPFASNNHLVSAAYFVASQSAYWRLWNGRERATVFTFWRFTIPLATRLFGYFPGWQRGQRTPTYSPKGNRRPSHRPFRIFPRDVSRDSMAGCPGVAASAWNSMVTKISVASD